MKTILFTTLTGLCGAAVVHAQGLMSIGPVFDDGNIKSLSGSFSSGLGWDSNPQAGFSDGGNRGGESAGSAFWSNSINVSARLGQLERRLMLDGSYSNTWYLDAPDGGEEFGHNARLGLSYSRQINHQLTVSNRSYVSYQTDPDFDVGATVNRRTGGSLYFDNSLSASYTWNHRFATVTGYTFSSVMYDDDDNEVGGDRSTASEDSISNTLSQQFRYTLDRRTTLTATYRFLDTNYTEDSEGDSRSHFLLVGADHLINSDFSVTGSVGAQYREYRETGDGEWAPYGEGALTYRAGERTSLRWHHRFGLEDTGNASRAGQQGGEGGFSYRTGLTGSHLWTRRLSMNASVNYVYQTFPQTSQGIDDDEVEQTVNASIGLNYQLRRRIGLGLNYSFTQIISDDPLQEYDRHSISANVNFTF
ncbi:MAG: outer membrane beta-barrel protein [Verrucomicrobiales bacterium]